MFRTALEEAARRLPGCEAAALVGRDGMVIEQWNGPDGQGAEVLAAELTPVLRSVEALALHAGGGRVQEVVLRLSCWTGIVQPINADTFLVLVAGAGSIPGRLIFEASRAASRIEPGLR